MSGSACSHAHATFALSAEHLADLRKSGLSDATIEKAQIRAVPPCDIKLAGVESAYEIPYFKLDGTPSDFSRYKLFPPIIHEDSSTQKYDQPKGTDAWLYLPPLIVWADVAADPLRPVVFSEGEKKSLCACERGLACIGIAGVWNWRQRLDSGERLVIPTLDLFQWDRRPVELCPDSDVWRPEKRQALQGFYALGRELQARGARVVLIKLPEGS